MVSSRLSKPDSVSTNKIDSMAAASAASAAAVSQPSSGFPLRFYSHIKGRYSAFSNFSEHKVTIDGKVYATSEHFYQASKHMKLSPHFAERVRKAPTAGKAKQMASQKSDSFDPNWEAIKEDVMMRVLEAKFRQHETLYELLLGTGDVTLIEASPTDLYWGEGRDGTGQNRLGVLLMQLRETFRREAADEDGGEDGICEFDEVDENARSASNDNVDAELDDDLDGNVYSVLEDE